MSTTLTLSRAAQLLGITRASLQKKISDGELASFDGQVASEELLRLYPHLQLEDSGAFERVANIKEQSFGRRVRERTLPSQEVLAQRLFAQGQELAELHRRLARFEEAMERLGALVAAEPQNALAGRVAEIVAAGLAGSYEEAMKTDKLAAMEHVLRVMSAHVTVKPSGREFFVEGNETVLEAALRSGLSPGYGCGNGNCGLCKARIVSGEVRQIQSSNYPLSAAEKAQNYALLCACTAVSDVVVELIEADSPQDIPEQQIVAQVRAVSELDAHTRLLHLQTPRSDRLRFLAGQSVTLGIAGELADVRAEYPIASCPCDDRNLLFHIADDPADDFAGRLFKGALRIGEPVNVRGPWDRFVLRPQSPKTLVFVAGDLGFAPIRSLIEHAIAIDASEAITLLWAVSRPDGHYLAKQCLMWANAFDNVSYRPLAAASPTAAGQAAAAALRDDPALAAADIYVAGPDDFVRACTADLIAAGIDRKHIVTAFDTAG